MIAAILLSLAAPAAQAASSPELLLQPLTEAVAVGSYPSVRVLVRNPIGSKEPLFVQRRFWLVPTVIPREGDLALRLAITGPDGLERDSRAQPTILVRMKTVPEMFHLLQPGEVFGQEIDLSWLQVDMSQPGTYVVQATISTDAQSWFDSWLKTDGGRSVVEFKRSHLFVGPMSSKPVSLKVRPER
jgi:hypothetical protein